MLNSGQKSKVQVESNAQKFGKAVNTSTVPIEGDEQTRIMRSERILRGGERERGDEKRSHTVPVP